MQVEPQSWRPLRRRGCKTLPEACNVCENLSLFSHFPPHFHMLLFFLYTSRALGHDSLKTMSAQSWMQLDLDFFFPSLFFFFFQLATGLIQWTHLISGGYEQRAVCDVAGSGEYFPSNLWDVLHYWTAGGEQDPVLSWPCGATLRPPECPHFTRRAAAALKTPISENKT